jgi:hypothetical protein
VSERAAPPRTPDGRYLVVIGKAGPRLWRASDPQLAPEERARLVAELMSARRTVRDANDDAELASARARVHSAKIALGERGPVWWDDGAPDLNRHLILKTGYAEWWANRSQCSLNAAAGDGPAHARGRA